ncbi:MAG: Uma2 family endonuclease [Roseofilum sp. SBFL]|nr:MULTISPECIES: Uma2 family endonuclease [unclassified Roseofilum]MBP0012164.1 Uma2 family endonuclease [Roseofilum sp. SID3]MBP0026424.1 Uma2 family endonuclease [Roseofilum sp. SID2]MBP0042201.1 Uma2 family endonuclease [Roseofilum sp. SBFL]
MVAAMTKQSAVEEYLEQENRNIDKSEFIQGEIIKMAGASANHNILTGKLHALLLFALEDRGYSVFMSDMRLWLSASESYVYPDIMAIAGEPMFTDSKQMALTNPYPCLIAEVLSSSTEGFDKNQKFALYRSIPQLQEYLLIDQFSYRVELYRKVGDRQWLLTELIGEDTIVELQSVDVTIKLADLYKRVQFEQSQE